MHKEGFMFISKIMNQIQYKLFPTEQQIMLQKWWSDGGDYKLRFNYDLNEDSIVLDLGGYRGQWASDIFSRYRCSVFIFEPVLKFANRIDQRFHKNDQIQVFPYGLGGSSRSDIIRIASDSSSVFRKSGKREKIEIVDVKDWISNNIGESNCIDLMKINIEGGEYELLDRLINTRMIDIVNNIQVQFHKISSNSLSHMEQIQSSLTNTHEPVYKYKFVWESWRRKISDNLNSF